jgi:ADP-ribose pyrophosphatase
MADILAKAERMQPEPSSATVEILHEARFLRLCRRGRWEYAERTNAGSAVIVVAVTPEDCIVFVEQFREPIQQRSIEMPAGLVGDIDSEESIELAAQRELEEETGWHAEQVEFLMMGPSSSGMSTEQIAFVRAHSLTRVGTGGGDVTENITVHEIPRTEAPAWLDAKRREGFSIDPKLYAGLYFVERNPDGSAAAAARD